MCWIYYLVFNRVIVFIRKLYSQNTFFWVNLSHQQKLQDKINGILPCKIYNDKRKIKTFFYKNNFPSSVN